MGVGFDERMKREIARRDAALLLTKQTVVAVGTEIRSEIERLTDAQLIEDAIRKHPYAATGLALGAGLLTSQLLVNALSAPSNSEPQRVVVQVPSGATPASAPAPSEPFDPFNFIGKATLAFNSIHSVFRTLATCCEGGADAKTGAPESAPAK